MDNEHSAESFNIGFGRGRINTTPIRHLIHAGSPAFSSTRIINRETTSVQHSNTLPDSSVMTDPALNDLITHIAQQVGQTIRDQLKEECRGNDVGDAQAQSSVDQISRESTYLNLTGAKLVLQSDVKEPPVLRGDGSDKVTVCEWEEMMKTYFKKRATPIAEQHSEIMCKLMGKAKDIVRITLRSSPSLKPQENPDVIYNILGRHFGEVSYSCMPMADFYCTIPTAGETPVEYWLRLNKAVDAAEEALKRLGRHLENPCQEAAMMFVKHCPDPSLAAVFKFKTPDKWTVSEIQEKIDQYQIEAREQQLSRLRRSKHFTVNVQTPAPEAPNPACQLKESPLVAENNTTAQSPCNDDCLKTLIGLFDRALSQNVLATARPADRPIHPIQNHQRSCGVCQSLEHSTLAHCRQKRLCLSCFEPNHIKRDCPHRSSSRGQFSPPSQSSQPLN